MPLVDALPELAEELQELLTEAGRAELALQIPSLKIIDRCRCSDDFCASFYAQPKPTGRYGPNYECFELEPAEGMLLLDVVAGTIATWNCSTVTASAKSSWQSYLDASFLQPGATRRGGLRLQAKQLV